MKKRTAHLKVASGCSGCNIDKNIEKSNENQENNNEDDDM